jgi:hypothetical protein
MTTPDGYVPMCVDEIMRLTEGIQDKQKAESRARHDKAVAEYAAEREAAPWYKRLFMSKTWEGANWLVWCDRVDIPWRASTGVPRYWRAIAAHLPAGQTILVDAEAAWDLYLVFKQYNQEAP